MVIAEILQLDCDFYGDLNPEEVLKAAQSTEFKSVMVIGIEPDGSYYIGSSLGNVGDCLSQLKICERRLVEIIERKLTS